MGFPSIFKTRPLETRDKDISALNVAIDAFDVAHGATSILPVQQVFGSVVTLLTLVWVSQDLY